MRAEIGKALKALHKDSPSLRQISPVERLLERMRDVSYVEFTGLIASSVEAPTCSRAHSFRFRMAILKMAARLLN